MMRNHKVGEKNTIILRVHKDFDDVLFKMGFQLGSKRPVSKVKVSKIIAEKLTINPEFVLGEAGKKKGGKNIDFRNFI